MALVVYTLGGKLTLVKQMTIYLSVAIVSIFNIICCYSLSTTSVRPESYVQGVWISLLGVNGTVS